MNLTFTVKIRLKYIKRLIPNELYIYIYIYAKSNCKLGDGKTISGGLLQWSPPFTIVSSTTSHEQQCRWLPLKFQLSRILSSSTCCDSDSVPSFLSLLPAWPTLSLTRLNNSTPWNPLLINPQKKKKKKSLGRIIQCRCLGLYIV